MYIYIFFNLWEKLLIFYYWSGFRGTQDCWAPLSAVKCDNKINKNSKQILVLKNLPNFYVMCCCCNQPYCIMSEQVQSRRTWLFTQSLVHLFVSFELLQACLFIGHFQLCSGHGSNVNYSLTPTLSTCKYCSVQRRWVGGSMYRCCVLFVKGCTVSMLMLISNWLSNTNLSCFYLLLFSKWRELTLTITLCNSGPFLVSCST